MADEAIWLRRIFNEGSDARLLGLARNCPYPEQCEAKFWLAGWDHVDLHWGADARWVIAKLPTVHGAAA